MSRQTQLVVFVLMCLGLFYLMYHYGDVDIFSRKQISPTQAALNRPSFRGSFEGYKKMKSRDSNCSPDMGHEANHNNVLASPCVNAVNNPETSQKQYVIAFYEPPWYISYNARKIISIFENCKFKNCEVKYGMDNYTHSDAVIFKGRRLPKEHPFARPFGQMWIFYEEEVPLSYGKHSDNYKSSVWSGEFNYTMTYDKENTDIYIPYGTVVKQHDETLRKRDFLAIARSKTKDALIITSRCVTRSKRLEYINELRKHISVDILGNCGKKIPCGKNNIYVERCFDIMNSTYRFYLAFENAFCRGYRTEKFYNNYNYDLIMVVRGDQEQFIKHDKEFKNTYISTSDFKNISALGRHLKYLSGNPNVYAEYLQRKAFYRSSTVRPYQQAYCSICERLNHPDKYRKRLKNIEKWAQAKDVCYNPVDLPKNVTFVDVKYSAFQKNITA